MLSLKQNELHKSGSNVTRTSYVYDKYICVYVYVM